MDSQYKELLIAMLQRQNAADELLLLLKDRIAGEIVSNGGYEISDLYEAALKLHEAVDKVNEEVSKLI
jgi:hypothetical protein